MESELRRFREVRRAFFDHIAKEANVPRRIVDVLLTEGLTNDNSWMTPIRGVDVDSLTMHLLDYQLPQD